MHASVEMLLGQLIVSCQAYADTPLYGSNYMKAMAASALLGGAKGIRACWKSDIEAIRSLGRFPIIGINKIMPPQPDKDAIFITPTLASAIEVIEAGCDILALDCRLMPYRDKAQLTALLQSIKHQYPHIAIMADCATVEECIFCEDTGHVDIISTTLSAYGHDEMNDEPDVDIILKLKQCISLPINAEGKIWDVQQLQSVIAAGADMVTIGTAITRPHLITERFVQAYHSYKSRL